MTKSNFLRGVTLAAIASVAALSLSACGTAGSGFRTTDYGTTGPLTVEQSSVRTTRNYMVDTITGYDRDGHKLPARALTMEESIMVAETDQYCSVRASEVEGLAMEYLQNGGVFSVIGAISQAAATLGVPGADIGSYASLGAGGFGGSGVATTRVMIRQGLTILHSSCMQAQLSRSNDPRVRKIAIYPVIAGVALRPRTGTDRSEPFDPAADQQVGDVTEDSAPVTTIVPM